MGRYFALTLGIKSQPRETKKKTKIIPKLKWGVFLVVLTVIFGALYLIQVNTLATKGYEIKQLERRVVELKESNKRLELEGAGLQSVQSIEEKIQSLNMVPSRGVHYLRGSEYAYQER